VALWHAPVFRDCEYTRSTATATDHIYDYSKHGLGLVHTSGWNHNDFFTAGTKRSVLNASEPTDDCFIAAFFQTQHALFSVLYGGRTAVSCGNGTRKNIPA
jgi:hypothetical protein